MARFSESKVALSDLETINRWVQDYKFIYQEKLISKKEINNLKFIISDNIRVGMRFKDFYFFAPFAFFKKKYYTYKHIAKHLKNKINYKHNSFYQEFVKSKYLYKDLKLKNKFNIDYRTNNILILGPNKRNFKILEARHNSVPV